MSKTYNVQIPISGVAIVRICVEDSEQKTQSELVEIAFSQVALNDIVSFAPEKILPVKPHTYWIRPKVLV